MKFILNNDQIIKSEQFLKKHQCQYSGFENQGVVGGRFTYTFTPTNLGTVVKLKCACGEEIDLTDYENW